MNTKQIVSLLIGAIALLLVTLTLFVLSPQRDAQFWITYIFTVLGIVAVTANIAFMSPNDPQFAANLTSVTISVVYLVFNIGCSLVLGALLPRELTNIYLLAHIILLGVFLIIWLVGYLAIDHINKQDR